MVIIMRSFPEIKFELRHDGYAEIGKHKWSYLTVVVDGIEQKFESRLHAKEVLDHYYHNGGYLPEIEFCGWWVLDTPHSVTVIPAIDGFGFRVYIKFLATSNWCPEPEEKEFRLDVDLSAEDKARRIKGLW